MSLVFGFSIFLLFGKNIMHFGFEEVKLSLCFLKFKKLVFF